MGQKDLWQSDYFDSNVRFADVYNGIFFHGEEIIKPEELEPCDSVFVQHFQNQNTVKVICDKIRKWKGQHLAILPLENQSYVDYRMVLRVMQEEIFGPLLPVLTYDSFSEVVPLLEGREKPLALYIFSEDKSHIREVTERLSFGGGCVNDVVIHLATSEMGFGGVGESGMGSYHGKTGFDTFSHTKSIVDKKTRMDLPMRYQPYKKVNEKLLHLFLK